MKIASLLVGLIARTSAELPQNGGYTLKNSEGCYNDDGSANRCSPDFHNIAYGKPVVASNTCGLNGPETFYRQTTTTLRSHSSSRHLRFTCDDRSPRNGHNTRFLTDNEPETTWWQSETLFQSRINAPNNVTLILDLDKAYEITYIRLRFHSPRPESMIIEKRTCETCPWTKFQYYSKTCVETFNLAAGGYVRPENEREAICESKMSKITPISGGDVIFSSLEGRPSKTNFERSPVLQEWVTATNIRITLVRLNTFGDEIFRGTKVLQSYYYAISDLAVGGRMKCNGHAKKALRDADGKPICDCQHNTAGPDCERCLPLYNNKPWTRATSFHAEECEKCDCNGLADSCVYDDQLGHGRCIDCQDNSDGPKCETCKKGFFKNEYGRCVPCGCNADGSQSEQCDDTGKCYCHYGVDGDKCDRCKDNFYNLARGGCTPCNCHIEGSLNNRPSCDAVTGDCLCKENVHGRQCKECKNGFMGLASSLGNNFPDKNNPSGCTACFCFGHSNSCSPAKNYVKASVSSNFDHDGETWVEMDPFAVQYDNVLGCVKSTESFSFPQKYLMNQRHSYNQHLKFQLKVKSPDQNGDFIAPARLSLVGVGISGAPTELSCTLQKTENDEYHVRLHESVFEPALEPVPFVSVLNNLTSIELSFPGEGLLDKVELETAREGYGPITSTNEANWVEVCHEPKRTPTADACSPYFTFQSNTNNPYQECKPCQCNNHAAQPCDIVSGKCKCEHNTCGDFCNVCCPGFYGNPYDGTKNDCKACPCPAGSECSATSSVPQGVTDGLAVVCNRCPPGSQGPRCERCQENFYGDPLGLYGSHRVCQDCQCNGNINLLEPGNCDSFTGKCLKCIHNTEGDHCEQCKDGFYGNPAAQVTEQAHGKGCTACECDSNGSRSSTCNKATGKCHCLPGVGGDKCDECLPQYFNLVPGVGCQLCSCDPIGSVSGECDVYSGQCECKPGVTGTRCDQCLPDHWGHSPEGCSPCDCNEHGSLSSQCNIHTGHCECRDGVMGMRCDQCEENYFYDSTDYECTKCPACYDLVQNHVNRHRTKLGQLDRLAGEVVNNPHRFLNDKEFEHAVNGLLSASRNFDEDVYEVLDVFEEFMKDLSDTNQTFSSVMLQLHQFKSQMETCERSISHSKNQQRATEGTISVIESIFSGIERALRDAHDQLSDAENLSRGQYVRHEELRSLYSQAMGALDKHRTESEKVQFAAKAAMETSQRAREQIEGSLDLLNDMKGSLDTFVTDDLKLTQQRITALRDSAKLAKQQATEAKNKVMALNIPTADSIPEIDDQKIKKMANEIELQAEDLSKRLDRLKDRLQESRDRYEDEATLAEAKYEAGRKYLNDADKLLASVHAAQQKAKGDRSNIDKLFKKSQHLVDVIKNYFADTNGDDISGEVDLDGITVESLDRKADALTDRIESYKTNVADMSTQAENAFEDAADTLKTADDNLKMANTVVSETTRLQDSILLDTENLNERDGSSFERKFMDKSNEVDEKLAESKRIASMASNAREQVDTLALNLDSIEALLAEIKDRDLLTIVDEISKTFGESETRDDIAKTQEAYQLLKDKFEAQKAGAMEKVEQMERDLQSSRQHLSKNKALEKTLQSEVDRLSQIHDALPNWCKKNAKTNESGSSSASSSADSSSSRNWREPITEQT